MLGLSMHHIGFAVSDIGKKADAYVQTLGYKIETGIIHDPLQQAYVQFLRFPGDRVYLELVQPDGPESKLSQAVSKGGGLHHVCYATGDIEGACRELREAGMFLISPPVPAVAFNGRRIAWLMGKDRLLTELVERGKEGEL
ncbi:MAG TPA: VOC family protein [Burkholderiales bacterium]|nr:VOC family protein [Burkholderiales bacterium]